MFSGNFASLAGFRARSGVIAYALISLIYGSAVLSLLTLLLGLELGALHAIAGIGLIGTWRYGWAMTHYIRAWIYRTVEYPRLRAGEHPDLRFDHIGVVITSFRIGSETNATVYTALLRNLIDYGAPATIVACITDPADAAILRLLMRETGLEQSIELVMQAQSGKGKRDAMYHALNALRERRLPPATAVVLMDGDTLLPERVMRRCMPPLLHHPEVGAMTLHNEPLVQGSTIAREWYRLRMAQRHVLMCSLSLSHKLLVLTGRFSVFRGEVALHPGFASAILADRIEHWRLGTIKMLSGDDKSTWFWTISRGWKMLYVPDVAVQCLEEPPSPEFFKSTTALMKRWYGNMSRSGARALGLGWRRIGAFPYMALVDQKLSMWTTLIPPTTILWMAVLDPRQGLRLLVFYFLWVLCTRTLQASAIGLFAGQFNLWFPFLLYYSQTVGSFVKIWAAFHPNVQRWTRQKIAGDASAPRLSSKLLMALSFVAFVLGVAVLGNLLAPHFHHG